MSNLTPTSKLSFTHDHSHARSGVDPASLGTPSPEILEKFGQVLDHTGIRGQVLNLTDRHGVQHKRGPSTWQQRRNRLERNLKTSTKNNDMARVQKWLNELCEFEQADFEFDFGASAVDTVSGAGGAGSCVTSGAVNNAAASDATDDASGSASGSASVSASVSAPRSASGSVSDVTLAVCGHCAS